MTKNKSVFISYSSKDKDFLDVLKNLLKEMNISYWVAPDRIPAGSNYAREIPSAIKSCLVFLLVVSENSQNSIWVEKELDSAICNQKFILPVCIDDTPLSDMFRFYLNNVQMITYYNREAEAKGELSKRIRQHILEITPSGDFSSVQETAHRVMSAPKRTKADVLRGYHIPTECRACGSTNLRTTAIGIYTCQSCGQENYDDQRIIRNYLEEHGPSTSYEIAQRTGIPKDVIEGIYASEYASLARKNTSSSIGRSSSKKSGEWQFHRTK